MRHLQLVVLRSQRVALEQLTAEHNAGLPRPASLRTIRRYPDRMPIFNYAVVTKPFLTRLHVPRRLAWGRTHLPWSPDDWGSVAFLHESSFTVRSARGQARVWRQSDERYLAAWLRPSFKSWRTALSVWAAVSSKGRTPLVRTEGRLNQDKYMGIIHEHPLPFVEQRHGGTSNFLLMEGNCGPLQAIIVGKYMALHGLRHLGWPAQSPDMNPNENP